MCLYKETSKIIIIITIIIVYLLNKILRLTSIDSLDYYLSFMPIQLR